LGLIDKGEDKDDILNDPVPDEEKFPQVVRSKMKENRLRSLRNKRVYSVKKKEDRASTAKAVVIPRSGKRIKVKEVAKETKALQNLFKGIKSQDEISTDFVSSMRNKNITSRELIDIKNAKSKHDFVLGMSRYFARY
jgi:hydroxylamine reductase (hybrid-cluster protein)